MVLMEIRCWLNQPALFRSRKKSSQPICRENSSWQKQTILPFAICLLAMKLKRHKEELLLFVVSFMFWRKKLKLAHGWKIALNYYFKSETRAMWWFRCWGLWITQPLVYTCKTDSLNLAGYILPAGRTFRNCVRIERNRIKKATVETRTGFLHLTVGSNVYFSFIEYS